MFMGFLVILHFYIIYSHLYLERRELFFTHLIEAIANLSIESCDPCEELWSDHVTTLKSNLCVLYILLGRVIMVHREPKKWRRLLVVMGSALKCLLVVSEVLDSVIKWERKLFAMDACLVREPTNLSRESDTHIVWGCSKITPVFLEDLGDRIICLLSESGCHFVSDLEKRSDLKA